MAHYHVVPNGRSWMVRTEKGTVVSSGHRKKDRAIAALNRAARPGDLKYIHGRNGQIQDTITHRG